MCNFQINFLHLEENDNYKKLIKNIMDICFKQEKLLNKELYVNIVLTNSKIIQQINKEKRNIDKATDVLSFPMFEKTELQKILKDKKNKIPYIIGDIVISIEQVKIQAIEYEHSFNRELGYMIVHGFYHILGYDHINKDDKNEMRKKEEIILEKLNIIK